jgi:DNA-binding transcriptional regulator YhcF (GntR family)
MRISNGKVTCVSEPQKDKPEQEQKHLTSIRVSKETVDLLKERGRKGESYDDIIRKLLEKRRR